MNKIAQITSIGFVKIINYIIYINLEQIDYN